MKVLVMDNTAYEKLMEEYKALIHKNQPHREAFASVPHGLHELRAAMTEIDIPDGCVLAVVDLEGAPIGEMLEIKPDNIKGISVSASHYRRIVQEVRLQ